MHWPAQGHLTMELSVILGLQVVQVVCVWLYPLQVGKGMGVVVAGHGDVVWSASGKITDQ